MAPSDINVNVLEQCRVAPPPGSVSSKSLTLTFFDLYWLPFPGASECLFFFDYPHSTTHFMECLLPSIKHSLSLTLVHFYPLAGSLSWQPLDSCKPAMINYVDGESAVSLTIAEFNNGGDHFHHLSGKLVREVNASHLLAPPLSPSGSVVPTMALQITLFPNTGICLGITIHHAVADGRSASHFIKSWASICKGDAPLSKEYLPFFDRSVIKDPKGIEQIYLKQLEEFFKSTPAEKLEVINNIPSTVVAPNMVRATFDLNRVSIEKLKELAQRPRHNNKDQLTPLHPSTFSVTGAFVSICLIKAGCRYDMLKLLVDCRARLKPPIPVVYFGNCVRGFDVVVEAWLSELLYRYLSGQKPKIKPIVLAGSPRFGFYQTDFGWGKPKKVELISIDATGALFLSESRDGDGGVEITLTLKEQEMDAFASIFVTSLNSL
ncbi:PREDICTED: malonyl-CoA:anthocyanidin 5-O-glucoside-6''-O-malonyltransferase-like [Nelumbo nucifera]|uniref:Phenolic glucoside malonyltransferase 1-like n=2 Tax=Nelumbo nucifera TaxID=4432 RepID=A0A822Z9L4_NELNU|nr:PREDICTED: malonyl-CoA:anthocyanidin 5-O-glucoside-6''-O-malonyltransferase-like [Nelumbo nucifera]DAD39736.1 TPA_asm: hypothetical protein HUJ06_014059 [Nelumbo nucifera]